MQIKKIHRKTHNQMKTRNRLGQFERSKVNVFVSIIRLRIHSLLYLLSLTASNVVSRFPSFRFTTFTSQNTSASGLQRFLGETKKRRKKHKNALTCTNDHWIILLQI